MSARKNFILPGPRGLDGMLLTKTSRSDQEIKRQAACFTLVYDPAPAYVNDHCFMIDRSGAIHLFHIVGVSGHGPYFPGNEVSFGHAISRDLRSWDIQPNLLSPDPSTSYEPDHIYAPFMIDKDQRYFMFYTGVSKKAMIESMCLAWSDDLDRWEKFPFNPIFRPSIHWAQYKPSSGIWGCCRDPHVIAHPVYGFILYYVTWIKGSNGRLVSFGAALSDNLVTWQDAGPVHIRERATEYSTTSMESPCIVERNGLYYLFYKHRDETRLVVSEDPLNFTHQEDVWFSPAHAAEIFKVNDQWYISSCSRQVKDTAHRYSDRTTGLYLARLDWGGILPVVEPFD